MKLKEVYFENKLSDGTPLYFDVFGSENEILESKLIHKPQVIFLHGGPGLADHNLYAPYWSKFSDIAQIIMLDMRGHGQSGGWRQEDKFNLRSWADDIVDFCEQLSIEKPVVVGFSFGGWVALDYAIRYPNHPAALILCNSEAKVDVELRASLYREKCLRLGGSVQQADEVFTTVKRLGNGYYDSKQSAQIYIEKCGPLFSEKPASEEEEKIWGLCKTNLLAWEVFDRDEQFVFDFHPRLHEIKAPLLSISGELDVEHPPSCAARIDLPPINNTT